MANEEEIMSFEITDWDLENEFNPDRIKRKPTKNQHIYGIWADDDSDDERPRFKGRSKKDYSAPISFISGGIREVGKKEEKKESDDDEQEEETKGSSDEEVYIPAKTGKSVLSRSRDFAGARGLNNEGGIGSWEKYTKGIGAKLLLQMGYQPGKGLGRDLQGISTPIEAKLRKGKGAIGLYGPEKAGPKLIAPSEPAVKETKKLKEGSQWKKTEESKKLKYVYKTVEEVKSEAGSYSRRVGDNSKLSKVKVIDMTGPEQKVFTGYHQLHQQHSKPEEQDEIITEKKTRQPVGIHFSVPELLHNLDLLVDMTEQKIIQNDQELQHERNNIVNLEYECSRLSEIVKQEDKQLSGLRKVEEIVNSLEERSRDDSNNPLTLSDAADVFHTLLENHYEEYKMFGLSDLAITAVSPLIKKLLSDWEPLQKPTFAMSIFREWKDLLETGESMNQAYSHHNMQNLDPYHYLVWEIWMPVVRNAIFYWIPKNCDPMIELLENWMPLLPPWIMSNILDQLILPRLQQEVEAWNPLTDTTPIHSWLHPWLPLLGSRLEPLYGPIRYKLANALTNWHPSDNSAKLILEPWRKVFAPGSLEAFVVTNILPKLALALQGMAINPHQQHLDVWHWVMTWENMCPPASMAALLEKNFFPQWHHVLNSWLQHNPNYEEVTKWYTGWKSLFSESLLSQPLIRDQFKVALDIMNRAVSNQMGYQPGARESVAYLTNVERQQDVQVDRSKRERDYEALSQTIRSASSAASLSLSFKDLIEKRAEEKNIIFMPIPNRYQEGKQVYRLGQVLMYLDRGVIFVHNGKTWVPTSLQSLLDMA